MHLEKEDCTRWCDTDGPLAHSTANTVLGGSWIRRGPGQLRTNWERKAQERPMCDWDSTGKRQRQQLWKDKGGIRVWPSCPYGCRLNLSQWLNCSVWTDLFVICPLQTLHPASSSHQPVGTLRYEPLTTRLKFSERCFSHAWPKAWNTLYPKFRV